VTDRMSWGAELTLDEIDRILRACGTDALLVGGQALAFWVVHYDIELVGVLSRVITTDADYIGTAAVARKLQRSLGKPWKVREGTLDDASGQVAKVYAKVADGGVKQVDFLSGIVGLDTDAIRRRAPEVTLADGTRVSVLHPMDVLESRLRNLESIPAKRNEFGVAQARLAVSVVRAFTEDFMAEGNDPRLLRQAVKRVVKMALETRLANVAFTYDIDVIAALPAERIRYPRFHELQWPNVLARLERRREKFVALQARCTVLHAKRSRRPGT
jgi:hypothetical protein